MSARDDLSTEQRQAMTGALARIAPATGEQVRQALSDARSVAGHNSQPLIHERLMRVEARVPAIVRRLLDTEAEVERLQEDFDKATAGFNAQSLRVTELEQQLTTAQADTRRAEAKRFGADAERAEEAGELTRAAHLRGVAYLLRCAAEGGEGQ